MGNKEYFKELYLAAKYINFSYINLTDSNIKERNVLEDELWDLIYNIWFSKLSHTNKKKLVERMGPSYSLASNKLHKYLNNPENKADSE